MKVCWEKFARYFEVELKEVKLREDYFVMDPAKAVEMVDENTICVAAILGSTLNGEFEDVKLLNDLLAEKNSKTGYYLCPLSLFQVLSTTLSISV
jgi:glutamate decarboxylase